MPGFIDLVVQPAARRGRRRRRRRRLTITTRSGLRCVCTGGIPADLAGVLLSTALAWRRRRC